MPDYGSDLVCTDDITEMALERASDDPMLVVEAVYRRLCTRPGGLLGDLDYGYDLRSILHRGMTQADASAISDRVRAECLKDDRVGDAKATLSADGKRMGLILELAEGPTFDLTLSAATWAALGVSNDSAL